MKLKKKKAPYWIPKLHLLHSLDLLLLGVKSVGNSGCRLAQARQIHRDVCSLLSSAADWLQSTIRRFSTQLPSPDDVPPKSFSESEQQQARMAILQQVVIMMMTSNLFYHQF